MKMAWIAATTIGVSAVGLSGKAATPHVIWNASPSVPVGFYRIRRAAPQRGEFALVRLKARDTDYVHQRGYLAGTDLLLKSVVAVAGDHVCRFGTVVLVGPRIVARARLRDSVGRLMPTWSGCHTLQLGELFLISCANGSFDSRYLGVIGANQVVGAADR